MNELLPSQLARFNSYLIVDNVTLETKYHTSHQEIQNPQLNQNYLPWLSPILKLKLRFCWTPSTAPSISRTAQHFDLAPAVGEQQPSSSVTIADFTSQLILTANYSLSTLSLKLRLFCSCGSSGEVCLLWNQLEPDQLSDGATGPIHSDGGGKRQHLVWNGVVAPSPRCFCCRFFSWPLPHNRSCILYLYSG